jgi:hypothetical protein
MRTRLFGSMSFRSAFHSARPQHGDRVAGLQDFADLMGNENENDSLLDKEPQGLQELVKFAFH